MSPGPAIGSTILVTDRENITRAALKHLAPVHVCRMADVHLAEVAGVMRFLPCIKLYYTVRWVEADPDIPAGIEHRWEYIEVVVAGADGVVVLDKTFLTELAANADIEVFLVRRSGSI